MRKCSKCKICICILCLFIVFLGRKDVQRCMDLYEYEKELMKRECELNDKVKEMEEKAKKYMSEILKLKLSLDEENIKELDEFYEAFLNIQTKAKSLKTYAQVKKQTESYTRVKKQTESHPNITKTSPVPGRLKRYTCEEVFHGTTFGYPLYERGFAKTPCEKQPLGKTVTLLLINPSLNTDYLTLNRTFQEILVVLMDDRIFLPPFVKTFILANRPLGRFLNDIINTVKTPFVLMGRHFHYTSNDIFDVERMLRAHETISADIIGGSYKLNGEWSRGCYQFTLKFYTLKYFSGYLSSEQDCLKCMHLSSPFLATTNILLSTRFDDELNHGVFIDFFLRLNEAKRKVYVCPDVMFKVDRRVTIQSSQMQSLVSKWDIKKIVSINNKVTWFGCRRNQSMGRCPVKTGMSVPPCCLENLKEAVSYIIKMFNINNVSYQMQEGTVLGLVKFQGILPWERDVDISFLSAQFDKIKKLEGSFEERGYELVTDEPRVCCDEEGTLKGGVFHVRAHGWSIQLYGMKRLNSSTIRALGVTVNIPQNPGLYVRNRYGYDVYKHVEHWMSLGLKDGWQNYTARNFTRCQIPNHHACLDQFQPDGDIHFLID